MTWRVADFVFIQFTDEISHVDSHSCNEIGLGIWWMVRHLWVDESQHLNTRELFLGIVQCRLMYYLQTSEI